MKIVDGISRTILPPSLPEELRGDAEALFRLLLLACEGLDTLEETGGGADGGDADGRSDGAAHDKEPYQ